MPLQFWHWESNCFLKTEFKGGGREEEENIHMTLDEERQEEKTYRVKKRWLRRTDIETELFKKNTGLLSTNYPISHEDQAFVY